jgi:hypothetical protein
MLILWGFSYSDVYYSCFENPAAWGIPGTTANNVSSSAAFPFDGFQSFKANPADQLPVTSNSCEDTSFDLSSLFDTHSTGDNTPSWERIQYRYTGRHNFLTTLDVQIYLLNTTP